MWRTKASLVSLGHLCHIRNENTNRNLLIPCPFNSIERKREREKIKHAGTANAHMPRRIGPIGPVPNAAAFGKQWITSQAILSQQKKKKRIYWVYNVVHYKRALWTCFSDHSARRQAVRYHSHCLHWCHRSLLACTSMLSNLVLASAFGPLSVCQRSIRRHMHPNIRNVRELNSQ